MAEKYRRVLLVSYYFPPLGMGGVGRPLGLFKYLPRFGFDVTVLTVKKILYPEYDHSLLEDREDPRIVRTGSYDPARMLYLLGVRTGREGWGRGRARSRYFPDSKIGWKRFVVRKAKRLIAESKFDAIITTSPPITAHLAGLELKDKFGLPWIADFRDLWFSRPIEEVYGEIKLVEKARELKDRILKAADEIVVVNNDIKKYLGKGTVITNGADPGLIDVWRSAKTHPINKFMIGVLGTINNLCPIEPLFKALAILGNEKGPTDKEIYIIHAGHYDKSMMADLQAKYGLHDRVDLKGYLPRKEAIKTLAEADLLYLGVGGFAGPDILPGRIFDYLISGKPILGVAPEKSDAAKLIREYDQGKVIAADDLEGIASFIKGFRKDNGAEHNFAVKEAADLTRYTSLAMAEKYADILGHIIR
ncbi:putative Group 1 glycosyl transferase [Candidatus Zixiibacteriota bacterium]|nr:putative Group 1 glycosyl transferase [candidate division Zixibacteria bacterium]